MNKKSYFSKVEAAREALKARAYELVKLQIRIVKEALKAKDFETAAKANQFLLEHAPPDENGLRVLTESIDKAKEEGGKSLPTVNIGFILGALTPKVLPEAVVIDVEPTVPSPEDPS